MKEESRKKGKIRDGMGDIYTLFSTGNIAVAYMDVGFFVG